MSAILASDELTELTTPTSTQPAPLAIRAASKTSALSPLCEMASMTAPSSSMLLSEAISLESMGLSRTPAKRASTCLAIRAAL